MAGIVRVSPEGSPKANRTARPRCITDHGVGAAGFGQPVSGVVAPGDRAPAGVGDDMVTEVMHRRPGRVGGQHPCRERAMHSQRIDHIGQRRVSLGRARRSVLHSGTRGVEALTASMRCRLPRQPPTA